MQATTDSTGKSFPAHFHDTVIAVSSTATTSAAASTATTAPIQRAKVTVRLPDVLAGQILKIGASASGVPTKTGSWMLRL